MTKCKCTSLTVLSSSFSFPNPPSNLSLSSFLSPHFSQSLSWSSYCLFLYFSLFFPPILLSLPLSLSSLFLCLPLSLSLSLSLSPFLLSLPLSFSLSLCRTYSSISSSLSCSVVQLPVSQVPQPTLFRQHHSSLPMLAAKPISPPLLPYPLFPLSSSPFLPSLGHAYTLTEGSSSNVSPNSEGCMFGIVNYT